MEHFRHRVAQLSSPIEDYIVIIILIIIIIVHRVDQLSSPTVYACRWPQLNLLTNPTNAINLLTQLSSPTCVRMQMASRTCVCCKTNMSVCVCVCVYIVG
jgi:hypothetical protein